MESHFRARGRRGPEPRGSAVIYSRSPASGWHNGPGGPPGPGQGMAECFGRRQRRGHQVAPELSFASASTSTRLSRGCASLSRTGRTHLLLPRVQRPRPGGDPERAASGPLPPDSIRPASSSATQITQRRAAQGSVDVGRQEEVFVKILLDTSFADDCFS